MSRLDRIVNVADAEALARRRLPRPIYDVVAGGAGDEITLRANRAALDAIELRPRVLVDVADRDLSTTVLGQQISMPVLIAPVGFQRMLHRDAELASARAAHARGVTFCCNTISTFPLERVASETPGDKWFQIYLPHERREAEQLVDRAAAAGYSAICLTVDTAAPGLRERDRHHRVTQPLTLGPRLVLAAARRPAWSMDFLHGGVGRRPAQLPMTIDAAGRAVAKTVRPVTPADVEWLRARWPRSLVVKGVLRGDDARRAVDLGVNGIVVSKHGGRQLDTVRPTIRALTEVVAVVGTDAEVFVDGGFRRGTDIAKALALGAKAVLIGKAFLFGLAAGGQAGVERILDVFRSEFDTSLALLGARTVADLGPSMVVLPDC